MGSLSALEHYKVSMDIMFIFENRFNSKLWTFILSLALDTSLWLIDNYYCKIYAFNSIISSRPAWKDSSKGVLESSQLDTSSSTWAWWNGDVVGIPLPQTNKHMWFLSTFGDRYTMEKKLVWFLSAFVHTWALLNQFVRGDNERRNQNCLHYIE